MKLKNDTTLIGFVTVGLVILVVGALVWANYQFSMASAGGTDFLVHWVGTRAFFIDGISPYSDETALRIQTMVYGRAAQTGEHELRVAYPLYSTFIFAPFAMINDYNLARAVWMTVLELALMFTSFLCLRVTQWKVPKGMLILFFLFSMLFYHSVRPVINGNAVILVGMWLVIAFWGIREHKDELAGIMLGLSTIKPQVVLLIIVFICLWAMYQRRWKIILWTVGTVAVLTAISTLLLPDWIVQNAREILRYPGYNPPGTPGAVFAQWWPAIGQKAGWLLSFILALILLVEWLAAFKREFRGFLWAGCLTLAIGCWIGIQTDPGNFYILFLPLTLIFAVWCGRWSRTGSALTVTSIFLLLFGIWILFLSTIEKSYQPIQNPIMFFPFPAFGLIGLYWVKWWAIQPPSLWVDLLMEREET